MSVFRQQFNAISFIAFACKVSRAIRTHTCKSQGWTDVLTFLVPIVRAGRGSHALGDITKQRFSWLQVMPCDSEQGGMMSPAIWPDQYEVLKFALLWNFCMISDKSYSFVCLLSPATEFLVVSVLLCIQSAVSWWLGILRRFHVFIGCLHFYP